MNADRNTNGASAWRWLNLIQRGSTNDWRDLYALCRNRPFAETVARALAWRDPDLLPAARLWAFLLEDLHPGLKVDLREDHVHPGV
jgi:hypothetical protein